MLKFPYDFIEIGTCDFDTELQISDEMRVGLSVEPISQYLDNLPNREYVRKVCAAIVTEEQYAISPTIDAFYVDKETVIRHNLGSDWLTGCNSIGKPHDFHTKYYPNPVVWHRASEEERKNLSTINLMELGLVSVKKVRCMTYGMLMQEYNVGHVNLLKTDTEGNDGALLVSVINHYRKNNILKLLPKKILFENNTHSKKDDILYAKQVLTDVGYTVTDVKHENGVLNDSVAILRT
jgi:hypothetical protein